MLKRAVCWSRTERGVKKRGREISLSRSESQETPHQQTGISVIINLLTWLSVYDSRLRTPMDSSLGLPRTLWDSLGLPPLQLPLWDSSFTHCKPKLPRDKFFASKAWFDDGKCKNCPSGARSVGSKTTNKTHHLMGLRRCPKVCNTPLLA
jgi:hypothetical protein